MYKDGEAVVLVWGWKVLTGSVDGGCEAGSCVQQEEEFGEDD